MSKLTSDHERRILALTGAGKSSRQVAEILAKEGCEVSHVAVGKFLRRARESRADAAKTVVRERLVGGLTQDLDRLELEAGRLAKIAGSIGDKIESGDARAAEHLRYLRVVDRLAKLTDLKLHYAGADTPDDDKKDDGAAERVLSKIATILERESPSPTTIQ